MQYTADSPSAYIEMIPEDRRESMKKLRSTIKKNLPKGFEETMSYGMIGYVVPHKLYPNGYHCDPKIPLPFMSIASQKNFVAVYHMGIYADPKLLAWFTKTYAERISTKLDMGKSCIRFKKPELTPFELIGELAGKMTVDAWVNMYESALKR
ncbi:MAG TPA: DUF1801 domain-containing protein [Flavobacteriales bacterium]|nr:DUF1801 domain-containing protein [Flavobacteriales bacterium]